MAVSGFSDDGQWWWDGTTWVATSAVVVPQLPATEFEKSGRLKYARSQMKTIRGLFIANQTVPPLAFATGVPLLLVGIPTLRNYRSWKLEQLALATVYLLGPNEAMLAGEAASLTMFPDDSADAALVVTAAHVLVFRFDSFEEQPRRVALAGRSTDVKIELGRGLFGVGAALVVSRGNERWVMRGVPGVFRPKPVLEAWLRAAKGTANIA
jgi:hypothetical protein